MKKKNASLLTCVYYRGLNKITKWRSMAFDLWTSPINWIKQRYMHQMCIKEDENWKIIFQKWYE